MPENADGETEDVIIVELITVDCDCDCDPDSMSITYLVALQEEKNSDDRVTETAIERVRSKNAWSEGA